MATFKGFSTFNFNKRGDSMSLTDVELIKRDILNGLFTPIGSVYKNRKFGTSIPFLLMKQMNDDVISKTTSEVQRILSNEPRISLVKIVTTPNKIEKSLTIEILFTYIQNPNIIQSLPLFLNYEG